VAERHISEVDLEQVMGFARCVLEQPVELLVGVAETPPYLTDRHALLLFTEGHPEGQKLKIDRSGLGPCFRHAAIVKETDVASYRGLVEQCGLEPARTRMIGNSPRSDLNPALELDLSSEMVALQEARNLFQINTRVLRTADEMSRSLLDVLG